MVLILKNLLLDCNKYAKKDFKGDKSEEDREGKGVRAERMIEEKLVQNSTVI